MSKKPQKQTASFSELISNPKRKQAEAFLARTLHALEHEHDVEPSMLAEVLFELGMTEMEPDDLTSEAVITWFSQLNRFRDNLQDKIDAFEAVYADKPTH